MQYFHIVIYDLTNKQTNYLLQYKLKYAENYNSVTNTDNINFLYEIAFFYIYIFFNDL